MELWVFKGLSDIVKPNFGTYPILSYSKTHFSHIPAFHYSDWGRSPKMPINFTECLFTFYPTN
jgi:hypothetical protein